MNTKIACLILCLAVLPLCISAKTDKKVVPPVEDSWNDDKADGDRSLSTVPLLFQDDSNVYVYSEKQLDDLIIGITDMSGNEYYQEVTIVPAGIYYAISIQSLPVGQYCFCICQGSNYVIGIFTKKT